MSEKRKEENPGSNGRLVMISKGNRLTGKGMNSVYKNPCFAVVVVLAVCLVCFACDSSSG